MQNLAAGRFDAPQNAQLTGIGAPHSSQNRLPSGRAALQLGHSIPDLSRQTSNTAQAAQKRSRIRTDSVLASARLNSSQKLKETIGLEWQARHSPDAAAQIHSEI
jgi:hypothetical protein